MDENDYSKEFSEDSFWDKLRNAAKAVGRGVVENLLTMYFAVRDKDTPAWAKAVIIGALGYFIFPLDAIPDVIPGAGFSDDIGAIAAALSVVAVHIKPEHKRLAKEKADEWFA